MKKSLILAALAIATMSTGAMAEIEVGQPYYMKVTTGNYYLNLEAAPTTKDYSNASLTAEPYIVYFGAGEGDKAGKFTIATSVDNPTYMGSNDTWQSTKSSTPYYWSFNTVENTTASNMVVTVQGHMGYMGPNNVTLTGGLPIYTNHGTDNANINWELIPVTEKIVNVTLNYKIGETTIASQTVSGIEGDSYSGTLPAFTTGTAMGTIPADDTTVDIQVTQQVPFQLSEDTEHMVWQAVSVHSNMHWILTYSEDESQDLVINNGGNLSHRDTENNPWTDEELWGFTGNLVDGFKIYNKKAGTDKTIYMADGGAKVGAVTENNSWTLLQSTAGVSPTVGCAFHIGSANPMNAQGTKLVFSWDQADAGSTWKFYSLADPMLNYYNSTLANVTTGNCVGDYSVAPDLTQIASEKAAAEASPYNADAALAFHNAIVKMLENTAKHSFDDSKWYRLENYGRANHFLSAHETDNSKVTAVTDDQSTNYYSIVKFVPVPETENRYYIQSQGMYLGHVTGDNYKGNNVGQVDENGDRGEFVLTTNTTDKRYNINDAASSSNVDRTYLHDNGYGVIVGWDNGTSSQWHLQIINCITINLSLDYNGGHIGTGYFPFPVKATQAASLYYIYESTHKDTNAPVMSYTAVETVPANTAFVVMSENNTVTLQIDYEGFSAQADINNMLTGSLRAATAEAGDYTFNGTDFVKSEEAPAIASNSAWIPASAVKNPETESFALVSPETTGIYEVGVQAPAVNAIFDLQGRRVINPSKGIYIINGVKTLIK